MSFQILIIYQIGICHFPQSHFPHAKVIIFSDFWLVLHVFLAKDVCFLFPIVYNYINTECRMPHIMRRFYSKIVRNHLEEYKKRVCQNTNPQPNNFQSVS